MFERFGPFAGKAAHLFFVLSLSSLVGLRLVMCPHFFAHSVDLGQWVINVRVKQLGTYGRRREKKKIVEKEDQN